MKRSHVTARRMPQTAPLKVAYVLKRFPRLSETFILNEILELERQGVEVSVFSLLRPPAEARHKLLDDLRAQVTYLPGRKALKEWDLYCNQGEDREDREAALAAVQEKGLPGAPLFPGKAAEDIWRLFLQAHVLKDYVIGQGIDHLHAHFGSDATTVALMASHLSGRRYSYTAHARDIYHTYVDLIADYTMRRTKMERAAFVATVSEYNKRHLDQLVPAPVRGRIHRLYNGIDLKRFRPNGKDREEALFVAVGRLVEKKGFGDLVEACRQLKAQGRKFRCVLVGEGPERESLTAAIDAADLGDSVQLVGAKPQEELLKIIGKASAVVLPCVVTPSGDRDGLPTVLLEALALGIPCVTTNVSGNPEIVDTDKTGYIVSPGDCGALAAAMARFLADPGLSARMANACRAKAERDFDLRSNVATLIGHFFDARAGADAERRVSACA